MDDHALASRADIEAQVVLYLFLTYENLIFAKADGTPISSWLFSSAFRNFMKRCPVRRIRFHDRRDTHASSLAKAGVPIEVTSKRRLGHSDLSIPHDRYITVYRDRDAEAAEAFGKIVT